jgi:hypothetical protein
MITKISLRRAFTLLAATTLLAAAIVHARSREVFSSLIVHEWGTFTSVAGSDGEAVEWLPLTGSDDLPSFVEHLATVRYKLGLPGTVRMETPVIYFYSPREESVSVNVRFRQGFITEWYPRASHVEPSRPMWVGRVSRAPDNGSIAWDAVTLSPSLRPDFPEAARSDHYFAARQTTATPLRVRTSAGEQQEKFLFYRGVAGFASPIRTTIESSGRVHIENHAQGIVPATILFERRGQNVGYQIGDSLLDGRDLSRPELTGSVDALAPELEGILVSLGLYQNEAHAMLETWRDSWFQEGSRLLYIVPRSFVDSVLPLSIRPEPQQITRVFVGRIELMSPETKTAIRQAVMTYDAPTLTKYGRFLEPFLNELSKAEPNRDAARQLRSMLDKVYWQMMQAQADDYVQR